MFSRFIIIAADEARAKASGCGIDSSVHFIKEVGQHFDVDLFDRLRVDYVLGDEVHTIKADELPQAITEGRLSAQTMYFDHLIQQLGQLSQEWLRPMAEGWTARFFVAQQS